MLQFNNPAFAPVLTQIHAAAFDEPWNQKNFESLLNLPTTIGWMADEYGFLLAADLGDSAEILTLAVIPDHQRQGYATQMIAELLQWAKDTNKSSVFLEVAADNSAAYNLYQKIGFIKTGTRPSYYKRKNGRVDAICMTRKISAQQEF